MTRCQLVSALVAAAVALTACTGVPTSSSPQVITAVGVAAPTPLAALSPALNADPRRIVQDFLSANVFVDENHANARDFLTADARNRWKDTTVTVLDSPQVGNVTRGSVTVRGRPLGSIDASGIYTPERAGDGSGGVPVAFTFAMKRVKGQWRIDALTGGLIISSADFQRIYQQRRIYFYDLAETHLVPDPRYSSLTDRSLLANWLVRQLAAGPRPDLQNAVKTELPAQTDPGRIPVILGSPATIELPGSSQLDPATRDRLAGQLALTLDQATAGSVMSIMDGTHPVTIPVANGPRFTAARFTRPVDPARPLPALYYIRGSVIVDATGTALPGRLPSGGHPVLTSAALASRPDSADLLVAATTGPPDQASLLVGTQTTGLRATTLHGQLTRPSWAPNLHEVWIGRGAQIYRVSGRGTPISVPLAGAGALAGHVRALRLSPDGSRVALVLSSSDLLSSQVWIGSVVRTPTQVRVDGLEPISPEQVHITDVAWNDPLKLFAVGSDAADEPSVYEVQVDGSLWTPRPPENLPGVPDGLTVAAGVPAWVSVGNTVWVQSGAASWAGPDGKQTTAGSNPIYLE